MNEPGRHLDPNRFADGLLDLLVGIGLLIVGFAWAIDRFALGTTAPALLIPLWFGLRPARAGARPGPRESHQDRGRFASGRLVAALAIGIGMLGLTTLLVVAARRGTELLPTGVAPLIPAFLVGLALVVAGWLIGAPRFVAYALVCCALALLASALGAEPELPLLVSGAVLCAGAATLRLRCRAARPAFGRE
jgi:hypothetical protein